MEKRFIEYKESKLKYKLNRSKRAKRVSLTVNEDGSIVATVPWYRTERTAERFIREKWYWLAKNVLKSQKETKIKIVGNKEHYKKYKKEALERIGERLQYFNQFYNFKINKISIRNQKQQWGSCSCSGTLSFNYRILFLPEYLFDYIVVHELCHMGELNHSKDYWTLVKNVIPKYRNIDKELRKYVIK